jgi:hypothetical protein
MPNICTYSMRVKGTPEAIDELAKRLTDYSHAPHFWRIFDAERCDSPLEDNGELLTGFYGSCAWSVRSCMMDDSPLCYACEFASEGKSTSLDKTARELGIDIEVYSEEVGCGFAEHYLYTRDGSKAVAETTDCEEYYWDRDEFPTFADFIAENGLEDAGISEEDMNGEDFITIGGYEENWSF